MIQMRSRRKYLAALAVDKALTWGSRIFGLERAPRSIPDHPRVLLIRCDHIGDAAMATVVLEPIRKQLQPDRIDVLSGSWSASLFANHPAVDRVHVYDTPWWLAARRAPWSDRVRAWTRLPGVIRALRAARYDIAIDLRGDLRQIVFFLALSGARERVSSDRSGGVSLLTRSWANDPALHEVEKNLAIAATLGVRGSGALSAPALPHFPSTALRKLGRPIDPARFVTVALLGNKPNRSWSVSEAARFAALCKEKLGLDVLLVGSASQHEFCEDVRALAPEAVTNLAGLTTLLESCAVIARAQAMIAVDSGPMHLAALVDTPVVALFGPGNPASFAPRGDRVQVVCTPALCACEGEKCDRTSDGRAACMLELRAEAVLEGLIKLLGKGRNGPSLFESRPQRARPHPVS